MRIGRRRRTLSDWGRPLVLTVALCLVAGSARVQDSLVTSVKASYLTKFAPFVVWPRSDRPSSAPFTICVVGKDPFGAILDRAVTGQVIEGRAMAVSRLATVQAHPPCQIAFLGGSRDQGVKEALRLLRGDPVLTVTDGGPARGVIDFALADGRVRFRVDEQAGGERRPDHQLRSCSASRSR